MSDSRAQGQKRKRNKSPDTEEPHLQSSLLPPAQLSPPQPKYADADLPASPPAISPAHTPLRSTNPLTEANLRTLDPVMPPKSASAQSSTSLPNASNVTGSKALLKRYHCFIDAVDAREANEEFLTTAKALAVGQRLSTMKPESVERTKKTWRKFKDMNETSFLVDFWDTLIPKSRLPMTNDDKPPMLTSWLDDHLVPCRDQLFQEKCVPEVSASSPSEKLLLEALPKLKIAKPDILYGLSIEDWATEEHQAIIYRLGLWASPNQLQVLPYLIVEGKSNNGNLEEAEVQAARAGMVLNACFRGFDHRCGTQPAKDGPDGRSKVYSVILSPNYARLNVHWVNVEADKPVTYHAHRLRYYTVAESEDWVNLRRDIENVLDWGVVERKTMILKMLNARVVLDKKEEGEQEGSKKRKTVGSSTVGTGIGSSGQV